MKQFSNDCNQILGRKRIRQENRLPRVVRQNLPVVGRFASFFARCW